jgi:hypothetical protein
MDNDYMFAFTPTGGKKDESIIQTEIIKELRAYEWTVMPTHGNAHQFGFPDLYCFHVKQRLVRWIEVKRPEGYSFTTAQQQFFPMMHNAGIGIWIMTSAEPKELNKLYAPPNWMEYYLKFMGLK